MIKTEIKIAHFYPDLLNLYGDRGNIITLTKRCLWRGIDVSVKEYGINDEVDFSDIDIAFIGGGSDREQLIVCKRLREIKKDITEFAEDMGVILGICGGYQLLGNFYQLENENIEGLSILDIYTVQKKGRLISNVVIENEAGKIVGFENHGGRTYINSHKPFGKVLYGNGNNGEDGFEGVEYKNVYGTYLHGPLLPKNPAFSDKIIRKALERKYKKEITLESLDDKEEKRAAEYIVKRFIG